MISFFDIDKREVIFSHIDDKSGEQTTFAVDRIIKYCLDNKVGAVMVPIEKQFVDHCINKGGFEADRLHKLYGKRLMFPMILIDTEDGDHLLIDGTHRYVKHAFMNHKIARAWVLSPAIWRQFVVTGEPKLTRGQLQSMSSGLN